MPANQHFANVEIRFFERQLLVDGVLAPIGARAFDLLQALVEGREQTMTKHELLDRVWPGLVVEENNLQVQVSSLRKVLGAQAIATIPGRGYRFTLMPSAGSSPAAAAAKTAPAPAAPTNLPTRLARLIGRDAEVQAVRLLIEAHTTVTVAGAGGMGKTRLAQAVAASLGERFLDGIWWIELAALTDPALVASAVARAIGAHVGDSRDALASVLAVLGPQRVLLVLDNCEHLTDAVAELVEALRDHAPEVRMLVTSQEPLKTADEHVYRLASLALPTGRELEGATECGAIALFAARACAADPRFETTPERLPAIVEICRRLDGIPLAIELAAARLPLLGLEGLRERLDERFQVLTAGSRVVLRRHQTLRATVEWSHALLSDDERTVLRRLGVFAGSFSLESAQRVAGDERIDRWAVLDHLGALVDKSMVLAEGDPLPRYRLLETTRAYAIERLGEAGETDAALRRHAESLVEALTRIEAARWRLTAATRRELAAELDNLRAALAWSEAEPACADLTIELAGLSMPVWLSSSVGLEGLERCLALRDRLHAGTPQAIEALFWRTVGRLGSISPRREGFDAAARAADLFRALGDHDHLYEALGARAAIASERGDSEAAGVALEEAARIERPDFPPRQRASMAWSRQRWLISLDRIEEALAAVHEQAALYREEDHAVGEAIANGANVAWCEIALGLLETGAARARRNIARLVELGAGRDAGHVRHALMLALALQGRAAEALVEARTALPLLRAEGDEARLLAPLALVAAMTGRHADAARVTGFFDASRKLGGVVSSPFERRRREATDGLIGATLTPVEIATEREAGARLSLDAALRVGLGDAGVSGNAAGPAVSLSRA